MKIIRKRKTSTTCVTYKVFSHLYVIFSNFGIKIDLAMENLRKRGREFSLKYFPPSPHKKLIAWATYFLDEFVPAIRVQPVWSPEYDRLLDEARHGYEAAEDARRRHKPACPRLDFQDGIEVKLRGEKREDQREMKYSPMTDDKLDLAPLSVCLESVLNIPFQPDHRLFDWRTALSRWILFRETADSRPSKLLDNLSAAQRSAFQILEDWWDSRYSHPALVTAARSYMESRRDVGTVTLPAFSDISTSNSLAALLYEGEEVARETGTDKSLYHSLCFKLFCLEFHPLCWEPYQSEVKLSVLYLLRRQAATFAISQRMAYYSAIRPAPLDISIGQSRLKAVMAERPWFEGADFEERPFYLWDAASQVTVPVSELPECPEYTCVSHTWGRWRKKGEKPLDNISGTRWPIPQNELYDVLELPDMLSRLGERYIWFDLFCIPQYGDDLRARIEISRQAAIFRNAKRCIAWINQCQSWNGVESALRWLALRFLAETNMDEPTTYTVPQQELSAMFEQSMSPVEVVNVVKGSEAGLQVGHLEPWFTSLWTLQEAALCPDLELYSRHWQRLELNGLGAVSLTTFGVFLHTAGLFAFPGTRQHVSVPFSSVSAYYSSARQKFDPYRLGIASSEWPTGVADLMTFQVMTSLGPFLLDLSPMNVLVASQRRQFSALRERSPAIMSAMGVTEWYKPESQSSSPSEPLLQDPVLLDNFSLSFTREAASKIGAEFFSHTKPGLQKLVAAPQGQGPCGFLSGQGTMLPFGRISDATSTGHGMFSTLEYNTGLTTVRRDEECVQGWKIMHDAGVEIREACVVSSSRSQTAVPCASANLWFLTAEDPRSLNPRWVASLEGVDLEDQAEMKKQFEQVLQTTKRLESQLKQKTSYTLSSPGDLTEVLRGIARGGTLYAVCLRKNDHRYHDGILLAALPEQQDSDLSWQRLVKVGTYTVDGVRLPPSTSVRWRVS